MRKVKKQKSAVSTLLPLIQICEKYTMNKKEMKKLKRVKFKKKMKNAVRIKEDFNKVFVELDFIKLAKIKCEDELMNALKNEDNKSVEEMLAMKMHLNSATLKVKDNVAVLSCPEYEDVIFNAEDNTLRCKDEEHMLFAA